MCARFLTQQCGFLRLLDRGDSVLADRGFNIDGDLKFYGAKLEIPAFTRGKKHLLKKLSYLNVYLGFEFT